MKLLLDTHTLFWSVVDDTQLSALAHATLSDMEPAMQDVTLAHAKEHLEELIERARRGEDVRISDAVLGAVKLTPVATPGERSVRPVAGGAGTDRGDDAGHRRPQGARTRSELVVVSGAARLRTCG